MPTGLHIKVPHPLCTWFAFRRNNTCTAMINAIVPGKHLYNFKISLASSQVPPIPFSTYLQISHIPTCSLISIIPQTRRMVSAKNILKMAKKWQKLAQAKRKRISLGSTNTYSEEGCGLSSSMADKGHFVAYTSDEERFVIPLAYLKTEIFQELFKMAEEEFGVPSDGPITLPCDSCLMEYALFIIKRHAKKELEKALLLSLTSCRSSTAMLSWHQEQIHQPICSF